MTRSNLYRAMFVICLGLLCQQGVAQTGDAVAPNDGAEDANMVELNFPERLSLEVLINYVSKRHNINFIHQEGALTRQVTLKAPHRIPSDALMALLRSVLKMHNMMVVPTEVPGMMRIEGSQAFRKNSVGPGPPKGDPNAPQQQMTFAVTRVLKVKHAEAKRAQSVVQPFLSAPQANIDVIDEHDMLIITDYRDNMPRIEQMLSLIDRPGREVLVRFVTIEHVKVSQVKEKVDELIKAKSKAGTGKQPSADMTLAADERTNRLAVVGTADAVDEAVSLIQTLDTPLGQDTRIYQFKYISAKRIDTLTEKLIGNLKAERLYESAVDEEANLLVATATPDIHERIDSLRESMDQPEPETESPIRFYKLENADAADVLATLGRIESGSGDMQDVSVRGGNDGTPRTDARIQAEGDGQQTPQVVNPGPTEQEVNRGGERVAEGLGLRQGAAPVDLPDARVMADTPSNSIIVIAPPSVQRVYQNLIRKLDVRRPQVLIEATVVILDTSDDFSLGVELQGDEDVGGGTLLTFSQFGLSVGDANTGSIGISPGAGFNGALLGYDVAQVIIRALERDSRTRVVSRPSVLVNDNATGTLASESEEPFTTTSQVAGAPSTTSFGGFATAGTNITITPQISEGDYLVLDYNINVSSFSGTGGDGVPPPRTTDQVSSKVTIPDGSTIIVGGLTRENMSKNIDRVPFLGSIPVLEYLFSNRSINEDRSTLFVFINATILRDDKFKDLKFLSGDRAAEARLAQEYPASEPLEID